MPKGRTAPDAGLMWYPSLAGAGTTPAPALVECTP
jgi:hypothetical protein